VDEVTREGVLLAGQWPHRPRPARRVNRPQVDGIIATTSTRGDSRESNGRVRGTLGGGASIHRTSNGSISLR
jgi:hypothetical protein